MAVSIEELTAIGNDVHKSCSKIVVLSAIALAMLHLTTGVSSWDDLSLVSPYWHLPQTGFSSFFFGYAIVHISKIVLALIPVPLAFNTLNLLALLFVKRKEYKLTYLSDGISAANDCFNFTMEHGENHDRHEEIRKEISSILKTLTSLKNDYITLSRRYSNRKLIHLLILSIPAISLGMFTFVLTIGRTISFFHCLIM